MGTLGQIREKMLKNSRKREWQKIGRQKNPANVLNSRQKAQIRALFAPYARVNFDFHNFYTAKTGAFHANYIPDTLHYTYIDPYFNNWREACYVDNKCFYPRYFHGVKQPEILCSRIGGFWFQGDFQQISREDVTQILERHPEIVVKKAMGSEGGKGVFFVKGTDFSQAEAQIKDDIVVQAPLCQHPDLARLNPTSVNTIRILSLLGNDGAKIYSAIVRIGVNGARVDNASSGGITCGIADGKLRKYAYTGQGQKLERHPDSGLSFENLPIPGYEKCAAAVDRLHPQIPRFRLISWDFSVDETGEPVLIEANLHYGQLDFHQLNNGPVFGDDTEKILSEVFAK